MDVILGYVDVTQMRVLAALIGGNFALAIAVAVKAGSFDVSRLADFTTKQVVPYVIAYVVAAAVAGELAEWGPVREVVWVAILASFGGRILATLRDFGIPVPDLFRRQ